MGTADKIVIDPVSNGGEAAISYSLPYTVTLTIEGTAPFLFHRWNCEAVEEKAVAAKNSRAKKTDNLESYVYRAEDGALAIPGEYLRQSIIQSAKYRQDPRSPRKSAMDLYKAGIVSLTELASTGAADWDYEDRRRVQIQRAGVTRVRPALKQGWFAEFTLMVQTPEYIEQSDLRQVIEQAGRLIGIGDFRPTFGRFGIVAYEVST